MVSGVYIVVFDTQQSMETVNGKVVNIPAGEIAMRKFVVIR